jgi:hypothetical protein
MHAEVYIAALVETFSQAKGAYCHPGGEAARFLNQHRHVPNKVLKGTTKF